MEREEILRKAQREGNDELEIQIRDKSIKWTYISMVLIAAIFYIIRSEQGYPTMDICAIVSGSVCVGQAYRYIKNRDKSCLVIAIVCFLVAVIATVRFLMGH